MFVEKLYRAQESSKIFENNKTERKDSKASYSFQISSPTGL